MGRNSSGSAISILYGIFVLNSMVESLWPTLDFPTTSVYEILTRLHVIDELQQIFYLLSMILDCLGQVFGLLLVHAYLRRQDHRIIGSGDPIKSMTHLKKKNHLDLFSKNNKQCLFHCPRIQKNFDTPILGSNNPGIPDLIRDGSGYQNG